MDFKVKTYESSHFTLAQIDRAIFEAIRLKLVVEGHLPDKVSINDAALYESEKQAIKDNLNKTLIEVFGVGPYTGRSELKYNHIIVDRISENDNLAKVADYEYEQDLITNEFTRYALPDTYSDIEYQITFKTNSIRIERLIDNLLREALPKRGSLKGLNTDRSQTSQVFAYHRQSSINMSNEPIFIEKIYPLTVQQVLIEPKIEVEKSVPVTDIGIDILPIKN